MAFFQPGIFPAKLFIVCLKKCIMSNNDKKVGDIKMEKMVIASTVVAIISIAPLPLQAI